MTKTEQLKKIRDEVINLKESPLYKERIKNKVYPVIGEGSHDAKVMFVGEAPGKNEAEQGRPFCGASGRVLDELLGSVGIARPGVYITNIVKDRPPNNRDPLPEEIAVYAGFLDRQISIIRPRIIATLGRFSMKYIMERTGLRSSIESISRIHGKMFDGTAEYGTAIIIPMLHPAVALYNPGQKEEMKKDFELLRRALDSFKE